MAIRELVMWRDADDDVDDCFVIVFFFYTAAGIHGVMDFKTDFLFGLLTQQFIKNEHRAQRYTPHTIRPIICFSKKFITIWLCAEKKCNVVYVRFCMVRFSTLTPFFGCTVAAYV